MGGDAVVWKMLVVGWVVALASGARGQEMVRPESHGPGVLLVVEDRSGLVTSDSPMYLASNRVGWNPGDTSMRLAGRSDQRWQILLPGPIGGSGLEFKFTRGSWETCEVAADLSDIPNRTLEPVERGALRPDGPVVVELVVERFADERQAAPGDGPSDGLRVTGRTLRVQVVGGAGDASGALRDVIVWLPPGYEDAENAGRRYPVLYMQDGQNVFDFRAPTPGEWGADETATRLIEAGEMEPVIIAAIPNSGTNRLREYLPAGALGVQGEGDRYLEWLVREVVPRVERVCRADGARRGVGGSSLGGLLALRAGQRHPEVFGRVLAESPSLELRGDDLGERLFGDLGGYSARTFIGMGSHEFGEDQMERNAAWVLAAEEMLRRVRDVVGESEVVLEVGRGAAHNELAWAARLGGALRFLYPTGGG